LAVVPDEQWMRRTFANGKANNPYGYAALKSLFTLNGSLLRSSNVRTSAGFSFIAVQRSR
jgi:hypothetical protein